MRPIAWCLVPLLLVLAGCKPAAPAADTDARAPEAASPAAAPAPLAASAEDRVKASMDKFLAAKSFHAEMSTEGMQGMATELDFVAPDRYRMKMAAGTQVIVGDTLYMQADGRAMKVPLPPGTQAKWRDPLEFQAHRADVTAQAQGSETVDGVQAEKFVVRRSQPEASEFTLWIGEDGRPLRLVHSGQTQGKPYTMTLRYSRYDDPSIEIPTPQ